MFDVVHPKVSMPDDGTLREALERGQMVLDVLIALGVPVTYARTRVIPSLLNPRERAGKLLGVRRTTAVLELEELIYAGRDERVAYSRDLFAEGGLDVTVMRSLESTRPTMIANFRGSRNSRDGGHAQPPSVSAGSRQRVASVARALALLDEVARSESGLGVNELARTDRRQREHRVPAAGDARGWRVRRALARRAVPARAEAGGAVGPGARTARRARAGAAVADLARAGDRRDRDAVGRRRRRGDHRRLRAIVRRAWSAWRGSAGRASHTPPPPARSCSRSAYPAGRATGASQASSSRSPSGRSPTARRSRPSSTPCARRVSPKRSASASPISMHWRRRSMGRGGELVAILGLQGPAARLPASTRRALRAPLRKAAGEVEPLARGTGIRLAHARIARTISLGGPARTRRRGADAARPRRRGAGVRGDLRPARVGGVLTRLPDVRPAVAPPRTSSRRRSCRCGAAAPAMTEAAAASVRGC